MLQQENIYIYIQNENVEEHNILFKSGEMCWKYSFPAEGFFNSFLFYFFLAQTDSDRNKDGTCRSCLSSFRNFQPAPLQFCSSSSGFMA